MRSVRTTALEPHEAALTSRGVETILRYESAHDAENKGGQVLIPQQDVCPIFSKAQKELEKDDETT